MTVQNDHRAVHYSILTSSMVGIINLDECDKKSGLMLFLHRIVAQQLITAADAMLKKGVKSWVLGRDGVGR